VPVVPVSRPRASVAPELPDVGAEVDENADPVTKCERCRQSFARHPSISLGDSAKWWLCPPCKSRLLGDVSRTNSRWAREA
jgi:hypothetical protein